MSFTSFFRKEFRQGNDNLKEAKKSVDRISSIPKQGNQSRRDYQPQNNEGLHISNTTNDTALLNNKPTSLFVPREKEHLVKTERQVGKFVKKLSSGSGKAKANAHIGLSLTNNRMY